MGRRTDHVVLSPSPAVLPLLALLSNIIAQAAPAAGPVGTNLEPAPGIVAKSITGVATGSEVAIAVPMLVEVAVVLGDNVRLEPGPEQVPASSLLLSLYGVPGI